MDLLDKTYKGAENFAQGGYTRVYRKRDMKYPLSSVFHSKGELVKFYRNDSEKNVPKMFWEFKIAHELFPKNVPQANGYRKMRGGWELHMQEVPIHKELAEYQAQLTKNTPKGYLNQAYHDFGGIEYTGCLYAQARHLAALEKVKSKMQEAGLEPSLENSTNVSFANPKKPVILELTIVEPIDLVLYAKSQNFSPEKTKRILEYLKRWHSAQEQH